MKVGIRKINQITDSKRKFYATNTLGFAAFTAGAVITTLSALSVAGAPGIIVGVPLLAAGAVSTGITNNIWTNKFKPRNGELGVDRKYLDLESVEQEIGERREVKKILKNYRDKHLPSESARRFGYSLLSSLPYRNEKGANLLHNLNQSRVADSDSKDEDRLDLLERVLNTKKLLNTKISLKETKSHNDLEESLKAISNFEKIDYDEIKILSPKKFARDKPVCAEILSGCKELGIDNKVLEKFIKNSVIKSSDEHDKSMKNKEDYLSKLEESGLFKIEGKKITFDSDALEPPENQEYKKDFMNSFEEYLLFDYIEKLKYEQYGLNDFYWALDKQNKKQPLIPISAPVEDKGSHVHSDSCSHSESIDPDTKDNQYFDEDGFDLMTGEIKTQQNEKEAFAPSSKGKAHVHSESCGHLAFEGLFDKDRKRLASTKQGKEMVNKLRKHRKVVVGIEPPTEVVVREPSTDVVVREPSTGVVGRESSTEVVVREPSTDVAGREPNKEISSKQLVEDPILGKKIGSAKI